MKNIRYLVMDVDGTLTDGKIYMGDEGEVMKAFNVKDGCAIAMLLPANNIIPVIITGRGSKILSNRCKELRIEQLYQAVENKTEKLREILPDQDYSCVAFIGDDINDLDCMMTIKECGGVIGCPADAATQVKNIAQYIATCRGGNGAVREFIEWLIANSSPNAEENIEVTV